MCLSYICSIESGFNCIAKAHRLPIDYKAFYGKEGIAILYKQKLQFSVTEIDNIYSERIAGLELKNTVNESLFILGVYMSSDESMTIIEVELNTFDDLYNYYCN